MGKQSTQAPVTPPATHPKGAVWGLLGLSADSFDAYLAKKAKYAPVYNEHTHDDEFEDIKSLHSLLKRGQPIRAFRLSDVVYESK